MSRTILLADDSVTIQKVIELTFMEEDYDVLAVSDGDEALEKLGEVSPDIVIADVHMPGASGLDVCRRSKEIHPDVPVLLLVGTFEPFDESEAGAAGADGHLKKPFDSQELLQLVGEMMAPVDGPGAEAGSDAGADSELGSFDLAEPSGAGDEAPETADDAAAGGGSDWGFDTPAPAEAAPASTAWATGAETVKTELGDMSWGEGSQLEVEAPPAMDQQEEPAPVWGDDAAGEAEDADAEAAGDDDDLEDLTLSGEEALEPAEGEPAESEPAESDWGFRMAQSVEAGDDSVAGDEASEATEGAVPAEAEAETADDADAVPGAFAATHPIDSYGSAEIEVAAYGGDERSGDDSEPDTLDSVAGLSEEDVDRIARRVTEMLGDRVAREVAWEVVPDLAEVVIRERLRELEGQLD